VDYRGSPLPDLPNAVRTSLYRFLQEALTNVAKHAKASQVAVDLRLVDQTISLSIADDGRGFDPSTAMAGQGISAGIGLIGMQERIELLHGSLEIEAQPGQGACLVAHIPWRASS
jgi:signal transduction histidine kinase